MMAQLLSTDRRASPPDRHRARLSPEPRRTVPCARALPGWATVVALLACLAPTLAQAWWSEAWSFRKAVEVGTDFAPERPVTNLTVPVRLHMGNFAYFLDLQENGADLRFMAGDDTTPLDYALEVFDPIAGVSVAWVTVPRIEPGEGARLWMYYGNAEAPAGGERAGWGPDQVAVYHFPDGPERLRDATAYGHHAAGPQSAGGSGVLGAGLALGPATTVTLPATPALAFDASTGLAVSLWIRPEETIGERLLLHQAAPSGALEMTIRDGVPVARIRSGDDVVETAAPGPLEPEQWTHLALTAGAAGLTLYRDGQPVATAEAALPGLNGPLSLGAVGERPGVAAQVDEVRVARAERGPAWVRALAASQDPDGGFVTLGTDESRSEGWVKASFGLLFVLLDEVRPEGWVIIGLIVLMGLLSLDVIIGKSLALGRIERADRHFLQRYRKSAAWPPREGTEPLEPEGDTVLGRLYAAAVEELRSLTAQGRTLPPQAVEVVRARLDAELVDIGNRLNGRLVRVTVAVSGGPFLGLLGTVVGVMVTFASIAVAGNVDVNTIAPGVAAALTTTVMGLAIAIPSLFGYNYLASRVARRLGALEVFADQLLSRLALDSGRLEGGP